MTDYLVISHPITQQIIPVYPPPSNMNPMKHRTGLSIASLMKADKVLTDKHIKRTPAAVAAFMNIPKAIAIDLLLDLKDLQKLTDGLSKVIEALAQAAPHIELEPDTKDHEEA